MESRMEKKLERQALYASNTALPLFRMTPRSRAIESSRARATHSLSFRGSRVGLFLVNRCLPGRDLKNPLAIHDKVKQPRRASSGAESTSMRTLTSTGRAWPVHSIEQILGIAG
jgi:hypothetical protein